MRNFVDDVVSEIHFQPYIYEDLVNAIREKALEMVENKLDSFKNGISDNIYYSLNYNPISKQAVIIDFDSDYHDYDYDYFVSVFSSPDNVELSVIPILQYDEVELSQLKKYDKIFYYSVGLDGDTELVTYDQIKNGIYNNSKKIQSKWELNDSEIQELNSKCLDLANIVRKEVIEFIDVLDENATVYEYICSLDTSNAHDELESILISLDIISYEDLFE